MSDRARVQVNFFRPGSGPLKKEVGIAATIILFWALLSFGIPTLVFLAGRGDPSGLGESFLTRARLFGFPLHYWLLAQGCTVGYVLLCKLYCLLWDRRGTR